MNSGQQRFAWMSTNNPLVWPTICAVPQPFTFGNPSPYQTTPNTCGPTLNLAAGPADGQNLTNGANWLGDPVVVADKLGHVFSLNVATATGPTPCGQSGQPACCGTTGQPACAPDRVAVAISTDDGTSFQKYQIVDDGSCSNGTQDQPSATVDLTTTPPTLWVVWRHQNISPFGGCIRGGQYFDADGRIWWNHGDGLAHDTDAQSISNMIEESTGVGQGGLHVQAGDGVVSVVYFDAGDYGSATPCCPSDGLKGVGLGIVSTPTSDVSARGLCRHGVRAT